MVVAPSRPDVEPRGRAELMEPRRARCIWCNEPALNQFCSECYLYKRHIKRILLATPAVKAWLKKRTETH
jgi:hypothetical protein